MNEEKVKILKDDIVKGIANGKDALELLRLSLKVIAETTNDIAFSVENRNALVEVYGMQKGCAVPLRWEIEENEETITAINKMLLTRKLTEEQCRELQEEREQRKARVERCTDRLRQRL